MQRPPRNLKKDRLISSALLFYAYGVAGMAIIFTSMFAYFWVYVYHGIPVSALAWTAQTYFQDGAPDFIVGSRVYVAQEQQNIYYESVSAWYATIIMCQFWNVWTCTTCVGRVCVWGGGR